MNERALSASASPADLKHNPPIVGRAAPRFEIWVTSLSLGRQQLSLADFEGRWLILIFYPRDFSFICPTELLALSHRTHDFDSRNCDLLGVSVDSLESHEEWLSTPEKKGGLNGLSYPLGSDADTRMSREYGVFIEDEGICLRGLFIIDPAGTLQYQVVHNLSTGRHSDEILRVLDALRTGGLCGEQWIQGEKTIDPLQLLQTGRVVGNYRIQELLGTGGFAAVFKAWDLRLDRPVAIKTLKESGSTKLAELLKEARPAARLSHTNICTVYAVEEHDTLPMIVMEYVSGRTLASRLQEGPMEVDECLAIGSQVAQGLAAAHAEGIAHGDIKPANIMIGPDGSVKILDFGLARGRQSGPATAVVSNDESTPQHLPLSAAVVEETMPVSHVSDASISGTPAYLSPERTWGDGPSPESDTFAFGVLLYEMTTGVRAFPGTTLVEIVDKIRHVDSLHLADTLPEPIAKIVSWCLRTQASTRPSMAAIVESLTETSLAFPSPNAEEN